jgi:hypothetical protein
MAAAGVPAAHAAASCLRGTVLDLFGYGAECRTERKLIADCEATFVEVLGKCPSIW